MDDKVFVTSMVSGQIGIIVPELRVKKNWPRKGTKLPISKEFLREAIYEPGVEYMFKHGILSIDDMDFKIELGLEQPEAKESNEFVELPLVDEKYMLRVLKNMPISEMRKAITNMSDEQKNEFINYAASQKDVNLDRITVIDELCNVNMLKIIGLKKAKEE